MDTNRQSETLWQEARRLRKLIAESPDSPKVKTWKAKLQLVESRLGA